MSDTRVALVTGASSGIGEETARLLRRDGFEVYAVARRVDRMAGLTEEGVHTFAMDVTDDASMTSGVQRVLDEQGRIDVLVNNAGYGSYGAVEDVPIDEARRQFEVNVFGLARLVQLVVPHMRDQKSGRIINISSIGGKFYEPLGAWYHATKFAVEGFSDSLRLELAPFGIHVVIVEPGPIITEWNTIARDSLVETSRGGAYEERSLACPPDNGARRHRLGRQLARRGRQEDRVGRHRSTPEDPLPGRQGCRLARAGPPGDARPRLRRDGQHAVPLAELAHRLVLIRRVVPLRRTSTGCC